MKPSRDIFNRRFISEKLIATGSSIYYPRALLKASPIPQDILSTGVPAARVFLEQANAAGFT